MLVVELLQFEDCALCLGMNYNRSTVSYDDYNNLSLIIQVWAKVTRDAKLIAKLETAADVHAMDAFYHKKCYMKLHNAARSVQRSSETGESTTHTHDPLVMAHLVAYMEENQAIYKLTTLRMLIREKLEDMGRPCVEEWQPHMTRFKDHLLELLPDWSSHKQGKNTFLSHKDTVSSSVAKAAMDAEIGDDEARKIVEVGLLMRKYILMTQGPFHGQFSSKCLSEPVATPLLTLIDVMLEGTASINAKQDDDVECAGRVKVACVLAQLICSNSTKRGRKEKTAVLYQSRDRETPFPLYVGLKLHTEGRLKIMIISLHKLGMCVSYDRIMEVRKKLALSVCHRYETDGVVIPSNMLLNIFTTLDVDNHDVSKSCNLSRDEFHGTSITFTNHLTRDDMGMERQTITFDAGVPENMKVKVPDHFLVVHPADINLSHYTLPDSHIKRTHYAHQVSLAALHLLKLEAYNIYADEFGPSEPFEIWNKRMAANDVMFSYWSQVYDLELLACRFIRSQREGDFVLYIEVLDELCPWFFAFDRTNYARWLPIHVRDM